MLIHRYSDGSEGIEYEVGDRVKVTNTICGGWCGWFDYGPTHAERCIVERIELNSSWSTAKLSIRHSTEWGCSECFPWMIEPHPETKPRSVISET